VGGIEVQVHEPVNVLSTMLLALTGSAKDAKPHPIASAALEHVRPFADHASLAWLRGLYRPSDLARLYGHAAQLAGPVSFAPRTARPPAELASYEPERMKDLPAKMAAFYGDARLGTFRRSRTVDYTLAEAEVKDVVDGAGIERFLADLYGPIKYKLVVVPVPTHPSSGGGTGARNGWEAFALLHPPYVARGSDDPVSWSLDPEATQAVTLQELSHAMMLDAAKEQADLVSRLWPVLTRIPRDAPLAREVPDAGLRFAALFARGSSASYLRRTRGDEAAQRWLEDEVRRLGTPLVKDFFLAIEQYLERRRWPDLHAFLSDLPKALRA